MIDRRELFRILSATMIAACDGVAAEEQHHHESGSTETVDIEGYTPRFFTDRQYGVVDTFCEIILPADEQSPGAHAAGVRFYLDTVLFYADAKTQQRWHRGLTAVDESALAHFGESLEKCTTTQQEQFVALMARNEKAPSTELERFFALLKQSAVDAYVLSTVGMVNYLGYHGNTAVLEFRGCTHPEHGAAAV